MGLLRKTVQLFGLNKPQHVEKSIGTNNAKDSFSEVFGNSSSSPSFSSFNSTRQQMLSFYDWVYAAASRVAEEASCIDIELYINNTSMKSSSVGRKIAGNQKQLQKYRKQRITKTGMITKNNKLYVTKAGQPVLEEVLEDHPLMELLDRPNKFMSGVEFFEMAFLHLELTGNAFWAIIRDKKKQPVELWPLYPNYMKIVPDEKEFIRGYIYTVNGEQVPFEPEDVIHIKYSDPNDLRWGMSTVRASARAIDTDSMAADYNRKFFYNSAQPDAVLYTDAMIDNTTWLRIKDQFQDMYGGTQNAHKTAILENGLKYQAMNPNQRDMEFLKSREFNRDMILAMFGVPKSVLGMNESVNRASAETAEYVFMKGTIKPKMLRLIAGIQEKLAPMFDERLIVGFVDPVPEDKSFKLQQRKDLTNLVLTVNEAREDMGYEPITNGDRLYISNTLVPIGTDNSLTSPSKPDSNDNPAADEDIHPAEEVSDGDSGSSDDTNNDTGDSGGAGSATDEGSSKTMEALQVRGPLPVPDGCTRCDCCKGYGEHYDTGYECYRCDAGGSVSPEEAKQPIPCGGRADSDELWVDENGNYRHEEEKGLTSKKKEPDAHQKEIDPSTYLDQRNEVADKYEPKVFKAVVAHTKEQEKEVLANVSKRFKALQEAKSKRIIKANLDNLFDPKKSVSGWQLRLGVIFKDIITAMGKTSIEALEKELGKDLPKYDVTDPSVEKFYKDRIRRISVYFDEETQKQLGATLREGIDAGESVAELHDRVQTVYKATQEGDLMWHRADRIGRTEPIFATTWTTIDSWEKSGVVSAKQWHTAPGANPPENNPCPFCRTMDGKVMDLDNNYFDQGDKMSIEDDNGSEQSMKLDYVDTVGPPLHPNCFDEITEVLSNDGWKLFKDIRGDEKILSVNLVNGQSEWVNIKHKIAYQFDKELVHYSNNRTDLLVTPDHNQIVKFRKKQKGRSDAGYWKIVSDNELPEHDFNFLATIPNYLGDSLDKITIGKYVLDTDTYIKFMAMYLSDGSITYYGSKDSGAWQISIACILSSPTRHEVEEVFENIFDRVWKGKDKIVAPITDRDMHNYLNVLGKSTTKYIPNELKEMDKHYLIDFLNAYSQYDGHRRQGKNWKGYIFNDSVTYFTGSDQLASDIGELILKSGGRPSYYLTKGRDVTHHNGIYTSKPLWKISHNKVTTVSRSNLNKELVEYHGFVYDVELEKFHTLFVRRNGKVLMSGNCRCTLLPVLQGEA